MEGEKRLPIFSRSQRLFFHHMQGRGLGAKLNETIFSKLKEGGIHTVIGGITLPNPASVVLHEKMGMRKVAHFEKVGFKFNQWHDVGYWQLKSRSGRNWVG